MEFFDPFGESTTNTTNKEMLKSRRASEASLFSTGSASSWNDFFSGTNTNKVQPKKRKPAQSSQPPKIQSPREPPPIQPSKNRRDLETESFIARMKRIEEERRERRKREDAQRWEREAEARRAAHARQFSQQKEEVEVRSPPALSYSEHISNEDNNITEHGNVVLESNLTAVQVQKVIQKLHPVVQYEKSKFAVGDVVQLCRLRRNTDYNGIIGTVKKYVRKDKLYVVLLETSGRSSDTIAVRGLNLRYPVEEEDEEEEEEEEAEIKQRQRRRRWRPDVGYNAELEWLRAMALVSKALDSKIYGDAHYIL